MRKIIQSICAAILLIAIQPSAIASKNLITLRSPQKIDDLLSQVPARKNWGTLASVIRSYGLTVSSVLLSEPDDGDINDGSFMYKKGDKFVEIYLKEPIAENPECGIWQPISFIVRKSKYRPESRTSNFLLTGKCIAPD